MADPVKKRDPETLELKIFEGAFPQTRNLVGAIVDAPIEEIVGDTEGEKPFFRKLVRFDFIPPARSFHCDQRILEEVGITEEVIAERTKHGKKFTMSDDETDAYMAKMLEKFIEVMHKIIDISTDDEVEQAKDGSIGEVLGQLGRELNLVGGRPGREEIIIRFMFDEDTGSFVLAIENVDRQMLEGEDFAKRMVQIQQNVDALGRDIFGGFKYTPRSTSYTKEFEVYDNPGALHGYSFDDNAQILLNLTILSGGNETGFQIRDGSDVGKVEMQLSRPLMKKIIGTEKINGLSLQGL